MAPRRKAWGYSARVRVSRPRACSVPFLERPGEPVAQVFGFNVHAGLALDGRDRQRVERVCRYLGRPPIAQERLDELGNARLRYTMKKPWKDGTVALDSSRST